MPQCVAEDSFLAVCSQLPLFFGFQLSLSAGLWPVGLPLPPMLSWECWGHRYSLLCLAFDVAPGTELRVPRLYTAPSPPPWKKSHFKRAIIE